MSEKCLELDRGICSKLANSLYQQKKQRLFCDIKIKIGNTACVYLHSCVLSAFSPCLDSLIKVFHYSDKSTQRLGEGRGNWSFKHPLEVTLTPENHDSSKLECEKCAMEFFDFLYIGKIKINAEHILHVEYLSSLLQVQDLLDACKAYRMKINTSGKLINNEIVLINESDQRKTQCNVHNAEKHAVKKTFTDTQSIYFRNKMRTLFNYNNNKANEYKEKTQILNKEMSVCSQNREIQRSCESPCAKLIISEIASINEKDFSLIGCNLLDKTRMVEKQKYTANDLTQSVRFPSHKKYKSIFLENIVSSAGKQACNFKKEETIIHDNSPEKVMYNESELIYESSETTRDLQSETNDKNNQSEKQGIPVIDLTHQTNISKLKEVTSCKENDIISPSEKEPNILGTKITFNHKKELLQLSDSDVEIIDSSCTTTVKRVHHCLCCDYFAKCHYDLLKHILLSNHQEKICSLCLYEADSWKTLSDHILQHNNPLPFFCSVCNERFRTLNAVNEHTCKHTGMVPCSCPICFDLFKSKHDVQKHITVHKEGEIYVCSECRFSTTDKNKFSSHSLILSDSIFECSQPNCTFKTHMQCTLNDHKSQHSTIDSYLCELCGDTFSKKEDLQVHIVKHETIFRIFLCSKRNCDFRTNKESSFKAHCRQHDLQNSYLCKVCGHTFSSLKVLQDHVKKHKENTSAHQHVLKPDITIPLFSCTICQFQTNNVNNLEQHMLKNHPISRSEILETFDPTAERKLVLPSINRDHMFTSSKVPVKFDSKSSNVKDALVKPELNAKTIPAEIVVLPDKVSGEYSYSNYLKNNLMKNKVLNQNFATNLPNVYLLSPTASLLQNEFKMAENGERLKPVSSGILEFLPIKKQKINSESE